MSKKNCFNLFSDLLDLTTGRKTPKFVAIRELWNTVMDNCQKSYFRHADVAVDEQLFNCLQLLIKLGEELCASERSFRHEMPHLLRFKRDCKGSDED